MDRLYVMIKVKILLLNKMIKIILLTLSLRWSIKLMFQGIKDHRFCIKKRNKNLLAKNQIKLPKISNIKKV
jgi:hypothetical protein